MKMGEGGQVEDFVLLRVGVLDSGGVNQQLACMAFRYVSVAHTIT